MTRLRCVALVLAPGLTTPLHAAPLAPGDEQPKATRISYLVGPRGVYGSIRPATHAKDVLRGLPKE